ncbi:MAG: helix-turn-helix domain-containing protein [Anaerovoracaceae bacterium]
MEFMTTKEASEMWGISARRVAILCEQGRIDGVKKAGKTWLLPPNATKPVDQRLKKNCDNIIATTRVPK